MVFLAIICGLLLVLELGLRFFFGFGNPLIYIKDPEIGYLLAPNQKTRRMGNRIEINQYSMRSHTITDIPETGKIRILLLGDSIANGGWWTDQAQTISSLLQNSLNNLVNEQQVEVLNASANSWSPRNELAYLQKFGTFRANIIILLINTDDLFGIAPNSFQVGRDRNYPDHKPPLAILEVLQRYIWKQQPILEMEKLHAETGDRVGIILTAISKIHQLAKENYSQLILAMTPLLREIDESGCRDYEITARQRLNALVREQQIAYIDFLSIFQALDQPKSLYLDNIHMNSQGNQLVTQEIERAVRKDIK